MALPIYLFSSTSVHRLLWVLAVCFQIAWDFLMQQYRGLRDQFATVFLVFLVCLWMRLLESPVAACRQ